MKKLLILPFFLFFFSFFVFSWWKNVSSPRDANDKTPRDFLVTRGQSLGQVAYNLEKQGFIKSRTAFKFYTQIAGAAGKIQPGEYSLSPSSSLDKMMMALISGPKELWVTYPEGLRREEIAAKTIKTLNMDQERAQAFWTEFILLTDGKEGYLFPETYLFAKDASAKTVVNKLTSIFETKVTEKMHEDAKSSPLSFTELVILASVVERETLTDAERPTVAGILLKRMDAGWPLQADATLQYMTGNKKCQPQTTPKILDCSWWEIPTPDDRQVRSPYNSYLNKGLPPIPIANPSISSLKAVIYPEESPYWYYIHDTDGKVRYAKDGDEHQSNINKYLR